MKQEQQLTPMQARRAEKRRRLRRRRIIRVTVVVVVLAFLLAAIIWSVIEISKASRGESASFFGVKAVEVEFVDGEGTVRYAKEDIIRASGIYVNQSLLAVNKVKASNSVLDAFPYLDYVEVKNTSFSTVCIRVSEVEVLAAVQTAQDWLIIGENNHVLERVTTENLPTELVRIIGAQPLSEELGGDALEERSLRVCTTICDTAKAKNVEGITTIDITEKTDLRMWWKDRVKIILGNESNLVAQVDAFGQMLPTLLEKNGSNVTGQLDMSSYADDKTENDRAVFTPADSLKKPLFDNEPSTDDPAADSTTATESQTENSTGDVSTTTAAAAA